MTSKTDLDLDEIPTPKDDDTAIIWPETRPRNIGDILNKLSGVKPTGDSKWQASCPCQGHDTPAKHLSLVDAGDKALVTCQGGKHTYEEVCQALGFDSLNYANQEPAKPQIDKTYDYQDEDGKLLFQVVRYFPKDFKQRRPDGKGEWVWNIRGVRRVLYHLPDITAARTTKDTIYITEGEKDADALWNIGCIATTSPGGAGKWHPEYADMLQGATVVVVPDLDDPGRAHAKDVAKSLYGKASSVKVLELPDHDTSDWIQAGGNADDLRELATATSEYNPTTIIMRAASDRLTEIASQPPSDDLIQDMLPNSPSAYGLLAGRSGIGKTFLILQMACCVASGTPFLNRKTKKCKTGLLTLEGAESKLAIRVNRIAESYPGAIENLFWEHALPFRLDDAGVDKLASIMTGLNFVIIDPLRPLVAGDYTSPKDAATFLVNLRKAQEKSGTVILLIHHIRKPDRRVRVQPEDLQFEIKGATEYVDGATSVLLLEKAPQGRNEQGKLQPVSTNKALHFVKIKDGPTDDGPSILSFNSDLMLFLPVSQITDDSLEWSSDQ